MDLWVRSKILDLWDGWMEARLPARRLGARRGVDMLGEDEELMCGSGGNEEEGKA
jgi:hypothetical protein